MKVIKVQESVVLTNTSGKTLYKRDQENPEGEAEVAMVTFKEFLYQRLADPKMSKTIDTLRATLRLKNAVDEAENLVKVEEEDWDLLVDVVKEPSTPYNPTFGYCLLPFIDAVVEAEDQD